MISRNSRKWEAMASHWHLMLLHRFGRRQGLTSMKKTFRSTLCTSLSFSHEFNSAKDKKSMGQERDAGLYHLTQLFGKFLKAGEDRKAANLMDGMTSLDGPATVVVCNYLLNSCSKTRNAQMAKEVWSFMTSHGVQMNQVSYGCMLCALSRGGHLGEAVDLLHQLFKRREANVVMYNIVLNACVHAKSRMYAARCVQLMESQGISKDELSYIELIKLSGMLGDLKAAKRWWHELISQFVPTPAARSPYVIALSRMNALTEARHELQEMVLDIGLRIAPKPLCSDEGRADAASSGVPSEPGPLSVKEVKDVGSIQAEAAAGPSKSNSPHECFAEERDSQAAENKDQFPTFVDGVDDVQSLPHQAHSQVPSPSAELPSLGPRLPRNVSTGLKNVQNAYNSLINAAGKANDHRLAETLFSEMRELGLKTDIYTYNALLRAVVDGRGVQHALRIVRRMQASGLQPDVHSLTALLEGYCQKQQLDKAEEVLEYMENGDHSQRPSCFAFNILLKACAEEEDALRALRVFAKMKESGIAPDNCTYTSLLSACGNARPGVDGSTRWSRQEVAKRVTAIEMDMALSGVKHTHESLTTVMRVLGAEGLTEAMLQRLQDATGDGKSFLDAASFNTVILSCVNAKQVEAGWDVFLQMKASGVKPDVYTYNILINGCTRDRNVSTAFELVDTMRQEGVAPDIVTFNSLLKVVCHSGEMEIVLDLLQKMTASGVQPDTATFNTILTSAAFHKRLDVTEHVVEEMRRRNVLPDQHTLLPVVSVYMRINQIDDAVEALRVLSLRMLDGKRAVEGEFKDARTKQIQDVLGDLGRKNINFREETRELLMDAVLNTSPESLAVYTAALAGMVHSGGDCWGPEQSYWTSRLSTQYDKWRTTKFSKSDLA